MADTAKVILLKGDPKKPESAEHIIKFPGGSISVCRVKEDEYWAHIEVHRGPIVDEAPRESKQGAIIDSRLDFDWPRNRILSLPGTEYLNHLAIKIGTGRHHLVPEQPKRATATCNHCQKVIPDGELMMEVPKLGIFCSAPCRDEFVETYTVVLPATALQAVI